MGTKESTQEMTETRDFDLPQDGFRLKDHPWLAADITVEDEIRYALDEMEYVCSQDIIYSQIDSTQVCAFGEGLIVKNWGDFVSYQKNDSKKEIVVSYNLNPYGLENQRKPEFISLVLKYDSSLDLSPFTILGNNAKIVFKLVNSTNSIHRISVEIKRSLGKLINVPYVFEISEGVKECEIPLSAFKSWQLEEIDEICFVLRPEDLLEDEGVFMVRDIEILV